VQLLGDHAQAARMAAAARRRAVERYSRQAMVERFERFFASLVFSSQAAKGRPCTGC
jgi:glycosyltransferase involved in cell wall biosynthesis